MKFTAAPAAAGLGADDNKGVGVNDGRKDHAEASAIHSVERAFRLLEAVAAEGGVSTISHLSAITGIPLGTAHRLLYSLESLGYAQRDESRHYSLGYRISTLAEKVSPLYPTRARPAMEELSRQIGESINLSALDGSQIVYKAQVIQRNGEPTFTEFEVWAHAHSTSTGKVLLANLPDREMRSRFEFSGLPKRTERTITDIDELTQHLVTVREQGFAVDDGEQVRGIRCFAVAVPGIVPGLALSITGPASRITDEFIEGTLPLLREATDRVSAAIRGPRN